MSSIQSFGEYRHSPYSVENVMRYGFYFVAAMFFLSTTSAIPAALPSMHLDTSSTTLQNMLRSGVDGPATLGASSAQMSQCNSPDPALAIIGCTAIIQKSGPPDLMRAVYSTRGMAHQKRGENDLAIADLDLAVNLDPKNAITLRSRGDFYQAQGEYDRALQDYNQAIAITPKNAEILIQRGNTYMRGGDAMHAFPDYDQAIALNPKSVAAYANRGEAYRVQGEDDRAIQDYNFALKLNAKFVPALVNRGLAEEDKGDFSLLLERRKKDRKILDKIYRHTLLTT